MGDEIEKESEASAPKALVDYESSVSQDAHAEELLPRLTSLLISRMSAKARLSYAQ